MSRIRQISSANLSILIFSALGGGNTTLEQRVNGVREDTVAWLASQPNVDGSWPSLNTQNVIFGLQLGDLSWLADQEEGIIALTSSRLEYELMTGLLPWKADSWSCPGDLGLSAGRLAQYILALQSTCISAEDFYGIDLHRLLNKFLCKDDSFSNFFAYGFGILAQCSNNVTMTKRALKRLAVGASEDDPCASRFADDSGHNVDILSLQVMAMVCARDQAIEKNVRNWDTILAARVQCLVDAQGGDGTFGNAITTALALQALTAADADQDEWECVDAVEWLLTRQTGGDFGGVASTAQIIPFLNCNYFGSLRTTEIDCPVVDRVPVPPAIQHSDGTVTLGIQVKVDEDVDDVESYTVTIIEGENLYYGMLRLAAIDSDFTFESSDSAFGQSIDAINGVSDDADASLHWTIRVGDENTHADRGISGLTPAAGDLYIFVLQDFS